MCVCVCVCVKLLLTSHNSLLALVFGTNIDAADAAEFAICMLLYIFDS